MTDQPPLNAAQVQRIQAELEKYAKDIQLRSRCVEMAIAAYPNGEAIVHNDGGGVQTVSYVTLDVAERIYRFIVGQSSSTGS